MAQKFLTALDMTTNEILNLRIENLASDPTGGDLYEGRIWINTTSDILKYYDGTAVVPIGASGVVSLTVDNSSIEDISGDPANPSIRVKALGITNGMLFGGIQFPGKMAATSADLDMNSHKITNVTDPTSAQDAATKNYVDTFVNGLSPKDNVRVATTATGTLATAFENGDTVDGVTLATGDRILIKNQSSGAENGIYVVAASGAPTRATDADSSGDLIGATVFVSEGTANGNTLWVMTTDGPITVNTTALVWSQFGGPGTVSAGTGIIVTGYQVAIDTAVVVRKYATDVGDGSSTSITVTHNLGTKDVLVQVYDNTTPFSEVHVEVRHATTNTVTLLFTVAPTSNQYRCVVHG